MARYVFTYERDGDTILYEESTVEEDRDDAGLTEFGGTGYLSFWERCRRMMMESGLNGLGRIFDLNYGVETVI